MQVELIAGQGCVISEIVGSLYELKTVHLHETHLILVKVRLPSILNPSMIKAADHSDSRNSEELFADLEHQLGDNFTSYLTVRLTYQHTAFTHEPDPFKSDNGVSVQTTTLRTQAMAYIKRQTSNSAWACKPRVVSQNPLVSLVETHYSPRRAREAIHRICNDRLPPATRRMYPRSEGASDETVRPSHVNNDGSPKQPSKQRSDSDIDPARKIWTEMRKTSRGQQRHHHRRSISQGTYSPSGKNLTPGYVSTGNLVDDQRNRIRQQALRNKRSVGADTLRSIAPSLGKGKGGGSVAGSLGLGRNWGWGGSWW